jgi:hypothetical protein
MVSNVVAWHDPVVAQTIGTIQDMTLAAAQRRSEESNQIAWFAH